MFTIDLEVVLEDPNKMRKFLILDKAHYSHLLKLVTPIIEQSDTKIRKVEAPGERLTLSDIWQQGCTICRS